MRRILGLMFALTLVFSLFASAAFAAGEPTATPSATATATPSDTATETPSETATATPSAATDATAPATVDASATTPTSGDTATPPATDGSSATPTTPVNVTDNTGRTETGGVYAQIAYSQEDGGTSYIPKFTMQLRTKEGKVISTVDAGSQNYDKSKHVYTLVFNHPGYKLGEDYQLILTKKDSVIKNVTMNVTYLNGDNLDGYTTILQLNQYFKFTIRANQQYVDSAETKSVKNLSPIKDDPLKGNLVTDSTKVGFVLTNASGELLKNTPLIVQLMRDSTIQLNLVSDDSGIAWVDTSKLTNDFLVYSKGKVVKDSTNGFATLSLPFLSQTNVFTFPVVFENDPSSGGVAVKVTHSGNTDLSTNWSNVDLTLTNGNGVNSSFTINHDTANLTSIVDGQYKVKASAKYADVAVGSSALTVKNGKGALELTVKPKFTLEVGKDGKDYKFSVINVTKIASKVYSGKKAQTFAVTPGESYMIKDNSTGEVITVAIDANSPLTRVVLGAGVVFGGSASSPHTGDGIMYLLMMFVAALIGAVVSFIIYNKKRKFPSVRTTALSLLLIMTLVTQVLVIAPKAYAAPIDPNVGSGSEGTTIPGQSSPSGVIQTDPTVSVLQIGFVHTEKSSDGKTNLLRKNSVQKDYLDQGKFSLSKIRSMFYMASNPKNDAILKASNSALVEFNTNYGYPLWATIYGKNPLYNDHRGDPNPKESNYAEAANNTKLSNFHDRILKPADEALNDELTHPTLFEAFTAYMFDDLTKKDANGKSIKKSTRELWAGDSSSSVKNFGDAMNEQIVAQLGHDWGKGVDSTYIMQSIFASYTDLLSEKGMLSDAIKLQDWYNKGEVVLFAQIVPSFYVKDHRDRGYAFMPFHDATEWYLWGRSSENQRYEQYQAAEEARVVFGMNEDGGFATNPMAKLAPTSTFVGNVRHTTAVALKPKSPTVKILQRQSGESETAYWNRQLAVNPFAGWGYMPWGSGTVGNQPQMRVVVDLQPVDANGKNLGSSFPIHVKGWEKDSKEKKNLLSELGVGDIVKGPMQLQHEGKFYQIMSNTQAPFTLLDEKNGDNININWDRNGKSHGFNPSTVQIPSVMPVDSWAVKFSVDIPATSDLTNYLGGTKDGSKVKSKYPKTEDYSDAILTLHLKALEIVAPPTDRDGVGAGGGGVKGQPDAKLDVPQWKLSNYFKDSSNGASKQQLLFSLALPVHGGSSPDLNPSGGIPFRLIDPNLSGAPWAYSSKAKLFHGDTNVKNVSVNTIFSQFDLAGDLLAVKDNGTIGNVKLADWKNSSSLFDGKIGTTDKGAPENKPLISPNYLFQYFVNSNHDPFIYSELEWVSGDPGHYERRYYPATSSYYPSSISTTVNFHRYIPVDNKPLKLFDPASQSVNGKYWESKQSPITLKINPEVLMGYDDQFGNTSVSFAAGDKLREVQPVSYNQAKYINTDVKPSVTGMSTATDKAAKDLATRLGAGGKEVIYKGASLTTNFEVKGELELKTFALDIGSSAYKNAWNPSTSYSTDVINNAFLSEYATKDASGKWQANIDAEGKLIVGGKPFGGQSKSLKADQSSQTVKEHMLEVRGGKLVGVDGNRNLDSLPQELKDALTRMKLMGNANIFGSFQNGAGDKLTEAKVATLGNAIRGTSDLAAGKGWYYEDTTTLVVREYRNTFTLPQHMYVDKLPMEFPGVDGLAVPINKTGFFSSGQLGHTQLHFKDAHAEMTYNSAKGDFGGQKSINYVVPNVSVLDSFSAQ